MPAECLLPNAISIQTFNKVLSRYETVAPEKLRELDASRYVAIPAAVAKRKVDSGADAGAYLQKEEVVKLVEWKLKHGTFRPSLMNLVQSNAADTIESRTRFAFAQLKDSAYDPLAALSALAAPKPKTDKLKGIGPATASLLLSVYDPESTPFFSDELFRWMMWEEQAGTKGGSGWERGIAYNVKEYRQVVKGVKELRERLRVKAVDVEKVAWILGKENVDVRKGWGDSGKLEAEGKEDEEEKTEESLATEQNPPSIEKTVSRGKKEETKKSKSGPKKTTKRKVDEAKLGMEGLRRSSRRRTET